ncbi:hypothetical protein J6590_061869 [Homalodisca vitripennis]|nr:hypothetical protein J6590_061869 [Homalodisca vitripennis]
MQEGEASKGVCCRLIPPSRTETTLQGGHTMLNVRARCSSEATNSSPQATSGSSYRVGLYVNSVLARHGSFVSPGSDLFVPSLMAIVLYSLSLFPPGSGSLDDFFSGSEVSGGRWRNPQVQQ